MVRYPWQEIENNWDSIVISDDLRPNPGSHKKFYLISSFSGEN
jgi:hypothetical protein